MQVLSRLVALSLVADSLVVGPLTTERWMGLRRWSTTTAQQTTTTTQTTRTTAKEIHVNGAELPVMEKPKTVAEEREEGEWKILIQALKEYGERFGNLRVPTRFKINPDDEAWPEECRGLRLGTKVSAIRSQGKYVSLYEDRREQLDNMGFEWQLRRIRKQAIHPDNVEPYEIFMLAFEMWHTLKSEKEMEDEVTDKRKIKKAIPKSFIVPRLEPWPIETRGLPLGQSVAALKVMATKIDGEPKHPYFDDSVPLHVQKERLEKLSELGLKLKKLEDHVDACLAGETETPSRRRRASASKRAQEEQEEQDAALSSLISKTDEKFELIVAALETFRSLEGHSRVPQMFVVPDEDPWPELTRGMALGLRITKIRLAGAYIQDRPDRTKRLMDLGLDDLDQWQSTEVPGKKKKKFDAIPRRRGWGDLGGDSSLPYKGGPGGPGDGFYPWSDRAVMSPELPEITVDDETGVVKRRSRFVPLTANFNDVDIITKEQRDRYRKEGWDFDEFDGDFEWRDVVQALIEFHSRYGDFDVPIKFVIGQEMKDEDFDDAPDDLDDDLYDDDDEYEDSFFGSGGDDLGDLMPGLSGDDKRRRKKKRKPSKMRGEDDDGLALDDATDTDLDAALAALLAAPAAGAEPSIEELLAFEAATNETEAPLENQNLFDDELRRILGVEPTPVLSDDDEEEESDEDEEESIADRRRRRFREPLHTEPWPAKLDGLKLGFVTAGLRVGDIKAWEDPVRKADLDKIDFDWGDREIYIEGVQWHHFLACLFSYSKIKGTLAIAWDFVIPDEEPWPLPLRNEKLGYMVNMIRQQETKLRQHFKYRAQLLESMGFIFLPAMFKAAPVQEDHRLPPCLRLTTAELEITREDRRRVARGKKNAFIADSDFIPPEPGTPEDPVHYDMYTVGKLKLICKHRGLKHSAKVKKILVDRLSDYDRDKYEGRQPEGLVLNTDDLVDRDPSNLF